MQDFLKIYFRCLPIFSFQFDSKLQNVFCMLDESWENCPNYICGHQKIVDDCWIVRDEIENIFQLYDVLHYHPTTSDT